MMDKARKRNDAYSAKFTALSRLISLWISCRFSSGNETFVALLLERVYTVSIIIQFFKAPFVFLNFLAIFG